MMHSDDNMEMGLATVGGFVGTKLVTTWRTAETMTARRSHLTFRPAQAATLAAWKNLWDLELKGI